MCFILLFRTCDDESTCTTTVPEEQDREEMWHDQVDDVHFWLTFNENVTLRGGQRGGSQMQPTEILVHWISNFRIIDWVRRVEFRAPHGNTLHVKVCRNKGSHRIAERFMLSVVW